MTEYRIETIKASISDGASVAVEKLDTRLQELGYIVLRDVKISINKNSDRLSYYHFSIVYKPIAGSLYRAKLFSGASASLINQAIHNFLTTYEKTTRVQFALDISSNLSSSVENTAVVVIYDTLPPWPLGEFPDDGAVWARAVLPIAPNSGGYAVAVLPAYISPPFYVYNAGPYTWKSGKDAIVFYDSVTERLVGFPVGCNAYGS